MGQHQFVLTGAVGGSFIYDRQTATNTFALDFEPLILYRVTDWLLFEGTIEANLPAGSSAEFQLPVATAQIFLNDYMEINAGIFDSPFGDWYEDQSPFWVNRFITAPLTLQRRSTDSTHRPWGPASRRAAMGSAGAGS